MAEKDAEIASLKKEIQKMKDHLFKLHECMPSSQEPSSQEPSSQGTEE